MLDRNSTPFNSFPPAPQYGLVEEEDMRQLRWRMKTVPYKVKRHTRFIIGAIITILLGIVFLFWGSAYSQGTIPNSLLIELGSIFIGTGVIGVAIDVGFQSQLARDVFQGAFGYLLHPSLREELKWIYDLKLIVTEYRHDVEIVPIPDSDYVTVRQSFIRKMEPLGEEPVKKSLGGGYDEYLVGGRESTAPQMTVTQGENQWSTTNGKIVPERKLNKDGMPIWECSGPEVDITSDKPVTMVWSQESVYWKNGEVINFFGTASLGALVCVKAPPEFLTNVGFANPHQGEVKPIGGGRYQLDALVLPLQGISVRWYSIRNVAESWQPQIKTPYLQKK